MHILYAYYNMHILYSVWALPELWYEYNSGKKKCLTIIGKNSFAPHAKEILQIFKMELPQNFSRRTLTPFNVIRPTIQGHLILLEMKWLTHCGWRAGGVVRFSHLISTDIKNDPDELPMSSKKSERNSALILNHLLLIDWHTINSFVKTTNLFFSKGHPKINVFVTNK